jgi:DNA-binding CsgD family transcriptional regulator/uncharacterized protein YhfF
MVGARSPVWLVLPMRTQDVHEFWRSYRHGEGLEHDDYQVTHYRTNAAVSDRMIQRISAGVKRAVASPAHYFLTGGQEPMPSVAGHALLLDHRGRPRLIWRTTDVAIGPLVSVTEEFVWRDGATSIADYLRVARHLFDDQSRRHGFEMHDDVETVFESFDVVWPPSAARGSRRLAPVFERGLAVVRRLDAARAVGADLRAVLDQMDTALMLIGSGLLLCAANVAAERILRRADGLSVKGGRIDILDPREQRALAARIAAVEPVPGFALQISRVGGRTPYRLRALSLRKRYENHPFSAKYPVLLLIDDPDAEPEQRSSDEALLSGIYSLTAAEARLAVRLASGASLTEVAETLGVTRNTVRSQLRAIFQKTSTSRQSELVVLLGRSRSLR